MHKNIVHFETDTLTFAAP